MEFVVHFLDALIELSNAMAPYILFGLLFAGILHEIVPQSLVTEHLGKSSLGSVLKATLFGVPLPVCSCGVIPLAASIKKSGASKGATLSFLISTPITGIDSILATYGIFGFLFTLYRVVTSMIIAVSAGVLENIFDKEKKTLFRVAAPKITIQSTTSAPIKKSFSFKAALQYGFGTLLKDIAKPLFWGLIIGALISVAVPKDLSSFLSSYSWLSYLIVIGIAIPMYVCATASLPIAASLILSGITPGAAFVFLSAGPATNIVTIGVVKEMLGKKALLIYLATIALGSLLFGIGLDMLFDSVQIDPKSIVHLEEKAGIGAMMSSFLLWGFLLGYLFQGTRFKKSCCSEC